MSDYSKLNIDRERIGTALKEAFSAGCVEGPVTKGKAIHYYVTIPAQEMATVVLHFRDDGRTTINPSMGKNTALATQAAEVITQRCIINEQKSQTLYIKSVPDEAYSLLIDHLRNSVGATVEEPEQKTAGLLQRVRGKHGDGITIHRYANKAIMIQGRPIHLYCDVVEILTDLLPLRDVIAAQLTSFNVSITSAEAESELQETIPTAFGFLPKTVKAILSPAITLRKIDVDLADYSCFVFPALRGLEGYGKQLFLETGLTVEREGFATYLDMSDNPPSVTPGTKHEMRKCGKKEQEIGAICCAISQTYGVLQKHRNSLFHVDKIPDMSRVIEKREVADSLVGEVLVLIESTYVKVQEAKS